MEFYLEKKRKINMRFMYLRKEVIIYGKEN